MTDLERVELAIRRAASQMPGGSSKLFRLVADELVRLNVFISDDKALTQYRDEQAKLD